MKNWLPKILAIFAGGANLLANGVGWKQVLASTGIALLGFVVKQYNVTGGTVGQTPEAIDRVVSK